MIIKRDEGNGRVTGTAYYRGAVDQETVSDFSWSDVISYEPGPPYLGGHVHWKRCTHDAKPYPGFVFEIPPFKAYDWEPEPYHSFSASACPALVPTPPNTPVPTTAQLLAKMRDTLSGRLPADVLPYGDLLGLFRAKADIARITNRLTDFGVSVRPSTFADLCKKLASADLYRKFAIKPLIDDMSKIFQISLKVDGYFRKLKERNYGGQVNFKDSITVSASDTTTTSSHRWGSGNMPLLRFNLRQVTWVGGTIHYQATASYNTSDAVRARMKYDALGLTNLFSTVWDAVPYSFLVDWFVKIGDFLAELDRFYFHTTPLEKIHRLDGIWVVTQAYTENHIIPYRAEWYNRAVPFQCPKQVFRSSRFRRYPVSLDQATGVVSSVPIGAEFPTASQWLTGFELQVQRAVR